MTMIWPLAAKLHPVLWQQRPRWTAGLAIPELPVLPWEDVDRPPVVFGSYDAPPIAALTVPTNFALAALRAVSAPLSSFVHPQRPQLYSSWLTVPAVVHQLRPYPPTSFQIAGTTKDATGTPLGNCTVHLFNTVTDVLLQVVQSDATGAFTFRGVGQPPDAYYLVAYKQGSPDVAATSVNTLTGTWP